MRGPLLILVLWLCGLASSHAKVQSIRALDPRPFGYFVGDLIERDFEIRTTDGDELVQAALPHPGAVNYWLELRSVEASTDMGGGIKIFRLKLVYQTFYAPLDPRKLTIPALPLTIRTSVGLERLELPAFTFIASPIREIFPEKSGETSETFLRPDPAISRVPTGRMKLWLAASSVCSALMLAVLTRHLAWWPFNRRAARPFSRAAHGVTHVLRQSESSDAYAEGLVLLHRAFDERAGYRVLASDVAGFLSEHPEHAGGKRDIERFFDASRETFFASDIAAAQRVLSASALAELSSRLAREERGAR